MTNGRLSELLSHFGPLAKNLTDTIVSSLQDQLHAIEECSSPEILEYVFQLLQHRSREPQL